MNTQPLVDERVKLIHENRALTDHGKGTNGTLDAEQQAEFDKRESRCKEIQDTLLRVQALDAAERDLAQSRGRQTETATTERVKVPDELRNRMALRAWSLGGRAKYMTEHMREACTSLQIDATAPEITIVEPCEERALSVGAAALGGNAVMSRLNEKFWEVLKWYGNMRQVATIWKTDTGATLPLPSIDDTANVGEIVGEAAATSEADPAFGTNSLGAFKYSSKYTKVSVELLQDVFFNLAEYLGTAHGIRIARIQNLHFTKGAGTTVPWGIATRSANGKIAASATAIVLDELIDLEMSVDRAYRDAPGAGFMMNDTTGAMLRKIKDTTGQYLWQTSVQAGVADRIFGRPVYINSDLDLPTAGLRPVLFGDFKNYVIRDTTEVVTLRGDELLMLNHQVVFLSFQRSDGTLLNTAAVKHLRML